jgi:hypothetical protein
MHLICEFGSSAGQGNYVWHALNRRALARSNCKAGIRPFQSTSSPKTCRPSVAAHATMKALIFDCDGELTL